ncbi:gag-polyprotein putative aspartyl protease [Caballeronia sp. SBC1]|uniref:retroviral-like aspartic protease family protein n=1 Tax=Caballeronia sp. SBC1 TaxID=2705548 RepID=UPI001407E30B|nr:retroviral-like aspartic protease family protein [Caballeronia sp. SBC1]QIN63400.1 gag-polyprotein putative aspartyl protease [Caballeronia sp. SBC1]
MPKADVLNESKKLVFTALGALFFGAVLFSTDSVAQLTPVPMYLPGGVVRVYAPLQSRFRRPPSAELPLPTFPGDPTPSSALYPGQPTPWHRQSTEDDPDQVLPVGAQATQPAQSAQASSACQLKLEATLPMTKVLSHYTVPVDIDGHSYPMMVDSGAERTSLEPGIADSLHLAEDSDHASETKGVGGSVGYEYPRIIPSLKLGSSEWIDLRVLAVSSGAVAPEAQASSPVGILGANVLSRYDVEFDFPGRTLSLYTASGCIGRFAPWQGDYQAYSADKTRGNRFILNVALNGHPLRAYVDTGTDLSLVTTAAADLAGVDSVALAHDPQSSGSGFGGMRIGTYRHKFSMTIGMVNYPNAPLTVVNTSFQDAGMLLGTDFMRNRRVWLSYSTGWVFMQTVGDESDPAKEPGGAGLSFKHSFHVPRNNGAARLVAAGVPQS